MLVKDVVPGSYLSRARQGVPIGLSDGSSGIFRPEDVLVVMTSSAFLNKRSDGGERVVDTKHRLDSREDR